MRRTISIVVAGVLAVGVAVTIAVSANDSPTKHLRVVRGVVSSENKSFFDDARVKAAFAEHGLDVQVEPAGSRQIVTAADPSRLDFAFVSGTPAAAKIATLRHVTTSYVPFSTPMTVATFRDIAQLLARSGIAHDEGGWWTFDTQRYLDLVHGHARWNQLPGNTTYPSTEPVLITSPDITTSAGAMYASIASYLANGRAVVDSPAQVDKIVNAVSPLFLEQGYAPAANAAPMVMTDEAAFVARAAARDGSVQPDMVLMYPDPGLIAKQTLVPLTPAADQVGRLLADDPALQQLAVEHGFRTAEPGAFAAFARKNHVAAPLNLPKAIDPPSYDNLEALVTRVDAALLAALGPRPSPPAITQSLPSPVPSTGPNRTGKP